MNYSELKINSHVGNFSCYISEETLVLWALSCFLLTIHIWMKNCTGRGNRKGKLHCYFMEINQAPRHHTPRGVSGKALKEREWGISKSLQEESFLEIFPKSKERAFYQQNGSSSQLYVTPGGLFIFWIFAWGLIPRGYLFEGALKKFLIVGHIPVEIFLLVNYVFHATHTRNRILKG